jgi:hypothetical protein
VHVRRATSASQFRRLVVLAAVVAVLSAGIVAATMTAGADVREPGAVTVTVHDGTLGTKLGPFTPLSGTFTGTVQGDGTLDFPQAGITFPSFDVAITNPIATTVTVTPVADTDFTGNVDPGGGLVTLTGNLTTKITLSAFGLANCPLGPMTLNLSTTTSGGRAYDAGSATVVDNTFVMPAIPLGSGVCGGYEAAINSLVGLPTKPGESTMTMPVTFAPILTGSSSTSMATTSSSSSTSTTAASTTTTTLGPPPGPPGSQVCPAIATPTTSSRAVQKGTRHVDATVKVDLRHTAGPANLNLTGAVWNAGGSIEPLQAVHPRIVRIDGSLQDRSPSPGKLDLKPLLARVAQVRAIGAEPLVILSYMPRWLGAPRAGTTKDPTRVAPYDLNRWEALVKKVVRTLALAPQPAYLFEVWNEPDIQNFWQDTPEAFTAMALRTHKAVADVKRQTRKPLQIGGPASAFGPNPQMLDYLKAVAAAHLPLDFVSWHKYANTPYLGPDGPEGNLPPDVYKALAKRNPNSTPLDYSKEIGEVRANVGAALAGSGLSPRFIIDEWNVSAGGYDIRHDDAEGASLVAGILIEMERAGLDEAAVYRAISGADNHIGDWGLVFSNGAPKPSWWVFRAWSIMNGSRLPTSGDAPSTGLWARATSDGGCVNVLLTNFVATGAPARTVNVELDGALSRCRGPRITTLATLDASSTSLSNTLTVKFAAHHSVTISMAPQSVALLRTGCRADRIGRSR